MNEDILNRNENINREFRKLDIWKDAVALYVLVKEKVRPLQYVPEKIKGEAEDSMLACHTNIAKGHSQHSLKDFFHYNNEALAALGENYSLIYALAETMDIDYDWFDMYDAKHFDLEMKLIEFIKARIQQSIDIPELKDDPILREMKERFGIGG